MKLFNPVSLTLAALLSFCAAMPAANADLSPNGSQAVISFNGAVLGKLAVDSVAKTSFYKKLIAALPITTIKNMVPCVGALYATDYFVDTYAPLQQKYGENDPTYNNRKESEDYKKCKVRMNCFRNMTRIGILGINGYLFARAQAGDSFSVPLGSLQFRAGSALLLGGGVCLLIAANIFSGKLSNKWHFTPTILGTRRNIKLGKYLAHTLKFAGYAGALYLTGLGFAYGCNTYQGK